MTDFSVIHASALEDITQHPAYHAGNALGWLYRGNKQAATNHLLSGRLYLAKSGWLLLSVPNALVRGVYDAMSAPGAELPAAGLMNVPNVPADLLNAHISVMTAAEVEKVGADNINERGHMFGYSLGAMTEITPKNVDGISKIWAIQVASPALSSLRKSYGLTPLVNGDHAFHITVAVRRKHVLANNSVGKCNETSAEKSDEQRNCNTTSRGELKAAEFSRSGEKLSRAGQNDLLPGGKADNVPDREISTQALAEGAKHEHEHTRNDQVAKEIAKDHLYEDPAYYKKVEVIEKSAQPEIVRRLLEAKTHSDNKRYDQKSAIIRQLMDEAVQDWVVDDPKPKYKGVTHVPTKFKFHVPPETIPVGVKAATNSVYANQALNTFNWQQPLQYDHKKPVFENIQNQLLNAKRRGDFIMQTRRNHEMYMSALSPQYRHQRMLQAFRGQLPQANPFDTAIENYGDQMLNSFGGPR
jgi:hypothetical protein